MTDRAADLVRSQILALIDQNEPHQTKDNGNEIIALGLVYIGDALHKLASAPDVQVHLNIQADADQPVDEIAAKVMRAMKKS